MKRGVDAAGSKLSEYERNRVKWLDHLETVATVSAKTMEISATLEILTRRIELLEERNASGLRKFLEAATFRCLCRVDSGTTVGPDDGIRLCNRCNRPV